MSSEEGGDKVVGGGLGGGGDSSEVVSKNQIYKNHSKLNETKSLGASEEDGDTLV